MSDALHRLQDWQDTMQAVDISLQTLTELLGYEPEAPLIAAVHALQGLATRQAAELTDTPLDLLEAWWMEHHFGERPMRAGLQGEALRDIGTLEELVTLICDDEEAA